MISLFLPFLLFLVLILIFFFFFLILKRKRTHTQIPYSRINNTQTLDAFEKDELLLYRKFEMLLRDELLIRTFPQDDGIYALLKRLVVAKEKLCTPFIPTLTNAAKLDQNILINKNPFYSNTRENSRKEIDKNLKKRSLAQIVWDRWYQENNINLLLYLGAFLIVSAAGIFVSFSWQDYSGAAKFFCFLLLTLIFSFCGLGFYKSKLYKSAGITFIGIGAILLP